jgi:enoyl-CoA hydratase/carnithine racemase
VPGTVRRRTATTTISAPDSSSASRMASCEENFPVPTMSRDVNSRPPRTRLVSNTGIPYHPRMAENVSLHRDGAIATVTMNRPDRRNALSDPMLIDLAAAFSELRDDTSTRVVIVTGAPPVFSAGADAGLKSSMSDEEKRAQFATRKSQFRRLFERGNAVLENLEQTTVAMINGHAVGGGWGLALACDFRIAAAEAQLWIPEVDLGVPLGVATTTRFVRLVGPGRAKEIIMGCQRYTATQTEAMGLTHRVVPGAELAKATHEWAQRFASKPARPLAEMKARINTIARAAMPEVNAMTEGFLDRG